MPIYDFVCCKCKKEFEALVMGGSKPVCPACGGRDLAKQMSACNFRSGSSGSGTGSSAGGASKCSGCSAGSCSSCH